VGTIQVLSEPTPIRAAYKEGTWTVEEIGKVMPQLVPETGGTDQGENRPRR